MTARAVRPTMRPAATAVQSLLAPDSARNPVVALRMQCACAAAFWSEARGVNDRSTDFLRGYAGPIALALTAALDAFMFRWTTQRSPADSSSLRRSRRAGHDRIGLMHDIAQRTIAVLGNDANASRLTRALPQRIATRVWSQKQLTLNSSWTLRRICCRSAMPALCGQEC